MRTKNIRRAWSLGKAVIQSACCLQIAECSTLAERGVIQYHSLATLIPCQVYSNRLAIKPACHCPGLVLIAESDCHYRTWCQNLDDGRQRSILAEVYGHPRLTIAVLLVQHSCSTACFVVEADGKGCSGEIRIRSATGEVWWEECSFLRV
jgi:hypothetical protein